MRGCCSTVRRVASANSCRDSCCVRGRNTINGDLWGKKDALVYGTVRKKMASGTCDKDKDDEEGRKMSHEA